MRSLWFILIVIGLDLVGAAEAAAQPLDGLADVPDEVQRTAEEILSSPEFRDFQRLREDQPPAEAGSRSDAAPRTGQPGARPQSRSGQRNRRPPDTPRRGGSDEQQQHPRGSEPDQPYPDGWRGGVEGGRDSIGSRQPPEDRRDSTDRANRAGAEPLPGRAGEARSPGGANSPREATSPGTGGGPQSAPGSNGIRQPTSGSGNDSRRNPGRPPERAERDGGTRPDGAARDGRTGAADDPRTRSRGSNRPFGDGWRGGEQGGRRALEGMTENEAREGGPGSERTPAGRNGSFRRPEGSGRNDSREGQRDARTSRSRDASESPRSSPEDRSAARPASGGTSPLGSAIGSLFHVLAWMFLAAVCAMIAYLIYRAISEFERAEKPQLAPEGDAGPVDLDTDSAPGEIPADVYVARARQFAQAGQFRDAVSQLLLGAMSHIERAGLIRYRRGLTLRDYLRAVRRAKPQFTGMKSMVRIYEPLGFGRRDATREHFESSLAGYEQGFKVG